MRHLMMTMGVALGLMVSGAAADTRASFDQIAADAQRVRVEAQEVKQLLRAGKPDFALVQQRLQTLDTHAQALRQSMDGVDASAADLTAPRKAALDRARAATDTLMVLLSNKTTMLADTDNAARQRSLLRAKADGIAKRAGIVEKQMARLRS
jgi:hypothetical protein